MEAHNDTPRAWYKPEIKEEAVRPVVRGERHATAVKNLGLSAPMLRNSIQGVGERIHGKKNESHI